MTKVQSAVKETTKFFEKDNKWYIRNSYGTELRVGSQAPRIDIFNDGLVTQAREAIRMVKDYGNPLFLWQKTTLMRWLAVDDDGKLVNTLCGLEVPRQNGKTELIAVRIIYGIISRGEHIVFTAQSDSTAETVKKRVLQFFYETDDPHIHDLLMPRWKKHHPLSLKDLELTTGGRVVFTTRHRVSGLGSTNDVLINDEAQEMTDNQSAALTPTVSASALGNPQVIYVGTPPEPAGVGFVFKDIREKAFKKNHEICWREWSVENLHDPEDVEMWYLTNPSMNLTVTEDAVRKLDLASLSDDSFNRQRLGWWSGTESKRAITNDQWERLAVDEVNLSEVPELVYAIKVAPDRGEMTLTVGVEITPDHYHVEVIDSKPFQNGHRWVVDFLSSRWRKCNGIIIDGWYGKQIIEEDLVEAGVSRKRLISLSMAQIADAHVFFYEAIEQQQISHFNQPVLNFSASNVKRRSLNKYGGFGWESMSAEISSAPLDSATFAYWGIKTLPRMPKGTKVQRMRM